MNREILFRGKRFKGGGFTYGSLVIDNVNKQHFISSNHVYQNDIDVACTNVYKVITETVGQFTGLTDKNGVKIFEGDVLSIEIVDEDSVLGSSDFYTGAVIYGRDYKSTNKGKVTSYPCSFTIHCNDWYMEEGLLGMNNHDIEIIGNIHDNPELIK